MRVWTRGVLAVGAAVLAGSASAQVLWLGGGVGRSWEYQADAYTSSTWHEYNDAPYTIFAAVPVDEDTLVRLSVWRLPHDLLYGGEVWTGSFRAVTLGVDYQFDGTFGRAMISAGAGQYNYNPIASAPPEVLHAHDWGWYVNVGEWFPLTRRSRLTVELAMHRPQSADRPSLFTVLAGLTFGF